MLDMDRVTCQPNMLPDSDRPVTVEDFDAVVRKHLPFEYWRADGATLRAEGSRHVFIGIKPILLDSAVGDEIERAFGWNNGSHN